MIKEVLDKFTGGQLTAIIIAAIFFPSAVGAAVSFQPVAIVDPVTGKQSYVDNGRRLIVYDTIAGYRNNPANLININGAIKADDNYYSIYTVPYGKAIVLTTAAMSYEKGISGNDNHTFCVAQTPTRQNLIANFEDPSPIGTHHFNFGSGIYLRSGDILKCFGHNGTNGNMITVIRFEGFLVPNTAVPATTAQVAAEQSVQFGLDIRRPGQKH